MVNHRGGAGPSKGGVNRVGDHFHGDRVVLGWGNQTCTSLTKAAPTSGLGFRAAYAQHDECLEPESMRWFGWMLARAEEIGKIVHELELAGARLEQGACRRFLRLSECHQRPPAVKKSVAQQIRKAVLV